MRAQSIALHPGLLVALALSAGLAAPAIAQPFSVDLTASKDNTLIEDSAGTVSNGGDDSFFAGRTNQGQLRRGLLAFNLSSIPAGSIVTGVTLQLRMTKTISQVETIALHRALGDWGEGTAAGIRGGGFGATAGTGDATWIHRFNASVLWNTPGGDFVPAPSASLGVSGIATYSFTGPGLVSDVQAWLNDPASNFGWFVLGDEVNDASAKRFASRESATASQRPRLTVTYIPAPGPVAAAAVAGIVAALRRRR